MAVKWFMTGSASSASGVLLAQEGGEQGCDAGQRDRSRTTS